MLLLLETLDLLLQWWKVQASPLYLKQSMGA
jgi:hypothetical protein